MTYNPFLLMHIIISVLIIIIKLTGIKNKLHDWSISACVYPNNARLFLIISSRVRTAVIDIKRM